MAMLALTRVPGVTVRRQNEDDGTDLLVSLSEVRKSRVFGVLVKGATTTAPYLSAQNLVKPNLIETLQQLAADSPFPIGLLFFDMTDDSGYFGWLVAPGEAAGELVLANQVEVVKINDSVIQTIVNDVDRWYDSRATLVTSRSA